MSIHGATRAVSAVNFKNKFRYKTTTYIILIKKLDIFLH